MQMNPTTPQGIGSLLGGQSTSPSAAVGSVSDRLRTFTPQQNLQRAGVTGALLDVMAAQKAAEQIKAAARNQLLATAAQQGQPPTVAEKVNGELVGETAKLVGGGIAATPAAEQVAPQGFAEGGIVAFAEGGATKTNPRERREGESFADYRSRMFALELQEARDRNATNAAAAEVERQQREAERQRRLAERGGEIIPPSPFFDRAPLNLTGAPAPAPQVSRTDTGDETARLQARSARSAPAPAPAPTPAPAPAPKPAPRGIAAAAPRVVSTIGGIAPGAAPAPAAPAAPAVPKIASVQDLFAAAGIDPAALRAAEEARAREAYAESPELEALRKEAIAREQAAMKQRAPDEMRWYEKLADLAANMGPASSSIAGTLGSVARTTADMRAAQADAMQKRQAAIDALRRQGIEQRDKVRQAVYGAGAEAQKAAEERQGRGAQIGATLEGTRAQAESEAASRTSRENVARLDRETQERIANTRLAFERAQAAARLAADKNALTQKHLADLRMNANKLAREELEKSPKFIETRRKDPEAFNNAVEERTQQYFDSALSAARNPDKPAVSTTPTAKTDEPMDFMKIIGR
jgi:hypothetical protein